MAVTQTGKIVVQLLSSLKNGLDLSTPLDALSLKYSKTLLNGTAANQANQSWHDQRTLAPSGTENLDFAGTLVDAFGQTLTLATIKAIMIRASDGNTNNVDVVQHATTGVPGIFSAAGEGVSIKPGGVFVWVAPGTGATVTAATGDMLTITNSGAGTGVTYDIVVLGTV
jgi:hypothetical protein